MNSNLVYLPLNLNSQLARSVLKLSRRSGKHADTVVREVLQEYFDENPIEDNFDLQKLKRVEDLKITLREQIGNKLAYLRQANYLSQRALGELVDLDQKTISNIEAGKRKIDILEVMKFSEIFDVTVDYFLG